MGQEAVPKSVWRKSREAAGMSAMSAANEAHGGGLSRLPPHAAPLGRGRESEGAGVAASQREVAFEIPLPQIIRSRVLEPLPLRGTSPAPFVELTVTTQNLRHRAGRGNRRLLQIQQPPTQLPTAPRGMLPTQRQHPLLQLFAGPTR